MSVTINKNKTEILYVNEEPYICTNNVELLNLQEYLNYCMYLYKDVLICLYSIKQLIAL